MNTSLINPSSSIRSTSTRVTRKPDQIHKRTDFYFWFFGQVHAKRCLIFTMICLTLYSLNTLVITSLKETTDNSTHLILHDIFNCENSEKGKLCRLYFNAWSYCCLLSILFAGLALLLVENNNRKKVCHNCFNPALLLTPFLLIMLFFVYPLGTWSHKTIMAYFVNHFVSPLEMACFAILPIIIVFSCYLYLFFGICRAFIYLWRQAKDDFEARETAAASFRSFRDRSTLIGRISAHHGSLGSKNRFTVGRKGSINRTYGTAPRPTLSSIFKDQNLSRSSSFSPGDFPATDRRDIEIGMIEMGKMGKNVNEMGSMTRRPLETVIEETEFHFDT